MKQIAIQYDQAGVSDAQLEATQAKLMPEIDVVEKQWGAGYDSAYASLSLPNDKGLHQTVQAAVADKQKLEPAMMIVVGIGGSNLGAWAVHEALQGFLYNDLNPLKIYWADTVDSSYISKIIVLAQDQLRSGNNILLTIISKSGTTTETIANAQVFIKLLQKHKPDDYGKYIVTITDEDSALWNCAKKEGWTTLMIPAMVGGRYSVFSAAGLFPLGMLGIDIEQLVAGAQSIKDACIEKEFTKNPAALSAAIGYLNYTNGFTIHDLFVFAIRLNGMGKWWRQLVGESIGKAESKEGKVINVGITPTVSIGSIDLHSVGQLYLAGPYNKFTTFLSVEKLKNDIAIPDESPLASLLPDLQGKTFDQIMRAILGGVQTAYAKSKRPFISVELPEISAYYSGQLLQAKMVKMMYLGSLFNINPFDQPQVELYKQETRKILAHE